MAECFPRKLVPRLCDGGTSSWPSASVMNCLTTAASWDGGCILLLCIWNAFWPWAFCSLSLQHTVLRVFLMHLLRAFRPILLMIWFFTAGILFCFVQGFPSPYNKVTAGICLLLLKKNLKRTIFTENKPKKGRKRVRKVGVRVGVSIEPQLKPP